MKHKGLKFRGMIIIAVVLLMVVMVRLIYSSTNFIVQNGTANLSNMKFDRNNIIELKGDWEFYWNKLLTSEDFAGEDKVQMNSFKKVPGNWNEQGKNTKSYPHNGVGTYRLKLKYPKNIINPSIRLSNIATAYKLYAGGEVVIEVGKASDDKKEMKEDNKAVIVDLPKDKDEVELVFQVANLKYTRGGIREVPLFGEKEVLQERRIKTLSLQMFFIGSVFIFGIHYVLIFLLQKGNKTALAFGVLCFITALRSVGWGEIPIAVFYPDISLSAQLYINYLTGYNIIPAIILFVVSMYPKDYNKKILAAVLAPTLLFEILLFTPTWFAGLFTNYLYILVLIQIGYVLTILIKTVLKERENSLIIFISMCIYILTIIQDILHYRGLSNANMSNMFLYGNFAVIMAMSFAQSRHQANIHKKLIEADKLKDTIMETEMSFLQAQIKPHFLYNALNAIANVCEKEGKAAGKLIIDLAVYLRGSLEFNNLEKLTTIKKELQFVDTYFHIEQARFGQKIQLKSEIQIPLDYQVPVLILQPLVENAVRHGISKRVVGGTVYIRMKQEKNKISIEIEDDGIGIEKEKLNLILDNNTEGCGVGLKNINSRLLRIYGRGLEITSEEGRGTCVRIVLPEGRTVS